MIQISKINLFVLFCSFLMLINTGCSSLENLMGPYSYVPEFETLASDRRIHYEPEAQEFAVTLSVYLSASYRKAEIRHYTKFPEPVNVYILASDDTFEKMKGSPGKTFMREGNIYLSPVIFKEPYRVQQYLTFELSHLLFYQHVGSYKYNRLPYWFREGLAAYVSDGGGAYSASEDKALEAIKFRQTFYLRMTGGGLNRFLPSSDPKTEAADRHLYNRQAMLFIQYIKFRNEDKFRNSSTICMPDSLLDHRLRLPLGCRPGSYGNATGKSGLNSFFILNFH